MMKPESKRPITIEDLLRLKRAERPPAEFWDEFDRSLRAKQLAALVEKRPWWQAVPRVFAGFKLYHLPIAATAVAVVAFISVRNHSGVKAPHEIASTAQDVVASAPSVVASQDSRPDTVAVASQSAETLHATTVESSNPSVSGMTLASAATAPGEISRMLPMLGASPATEEQSPSARAIAANLASVRGNEPMLARTLLSNAALAEVQSSSRTAIEPLQQITPPGERRRSNLTTAMVSMTSFETPARNGERVANRLSEDELYDRIHRFGARGNSVSMKF